mmetsp:Transcript_10459/g.23111  ORF Transcript_10459/g.23111 Transcript_10459/m.23111 type:complete len:242 (-) Transcript_10459:94-819(-)|eukprot:CAMPEP_0113310402 /NCGR_PEP_ID=MMETSP0010_2-20120614/8062_1 /TAXON_ID=216773 ORGANISM="Corethron hystrix, Strain 308" /NCGR_SAMPLE_ID=MMETSP0010_2 /ASSEMBLY_ACC=CAM_ASM_000155 /LENGTH=241 /DNA_ID=CAMNT_0000165851 /DNA_START=70 /DNA_END=795 /DNA_ORIENTATION=+ /assembly_acc=CAM_ASM_000155
MMIRLTLTILTIAISGNPTAITHAFRNGDTCGVTSKDFLNYDFSSDWMVAGNAGCTLGDSTGCFCAPNLADGKSLGEWEWQCNNVVSFGPNESLSKTCPVMVPVDKDMGQLDFVGNVARALGASSSDNNEDNFLDPESQQQLTGVSCDTAIHPTGRPGDEFCPYSNCDEGGDHSAICACIDREAYGIGEGMEWVCMHATCSCGENEEEEELKKSLPESSANAPITSVMASFSMMALVVLLT